ncbi:MAG: response regulator [Alphaproteobacteria bacterium]|nr:response regulator [Alphaproteobacteria bacterium]
MARILIAEDDQSMSGFLVMALEKAGHKAVAAENGLDALKILEEDEKEFDLLLTDIVMPGMDGIELSNKATKLRENLKVMFITGFAAVAMGRDDLDADKAEILSKPFHLNDLVKQVETLLAA